MAKAKASFVVACHNGQAYLAETLDSLVNQNLRQIEIVLVDDGSTDNTRRIMNYYAKMDKRIRVIALDKNVGRSEARNIGVRDAKTDLILISDADDINNWNRAKKTVKFMKDNPDVDLTYGGFWVIDEKSVTQGESAMHEFDWEKSLKDKNHFFAICHSTMAFRKKMFDKVQYTDGEPSELGIDDWFFQAHAHQRGFKIKGMDAPLVYYRYVEKPRNEKRILELKKECLGLPN